MSTKQNSTQIDVYDCSGTRLLGRVPAATPADVEEVLARADTARELARKTPTHRRVTALREVAEGVKQESEIFAKLIASEGAKTIREARKEVTRCVETLRISSEEARRLVGETIAFDQVPGSENRVGYYVRKGLGVVLAVTPFNDPLNLVAHKIGPAIAGGNAIILKPHSSTPLSAIKLGKLFKQTDLPADMLQVITGRGALVGDLMVADPRVNMVSFTGGPVVGRQIAAKAGLKKISMELGSNCPTLVMADADFQKALEATLSGAFWAAGQNCLHVQRILIQEPLFERFAEAFTASASRLKVGDQMSESTDMGPMLNEQLAIGVEEFVQDAVSHGATVRCGGTRDGHFFTPTVLTDVDPQCRISQEEVFGPVVALYPFNEVQQGIEIANGVDYGLQAAAFTRDITLAHQLLDELDYGTVLINDSSDYRIDAMPFGGTKGSGLGREGVAFAIREMTEVKTCCFNL